MVVASAKVLIVFYIYIQYVMISTTKKVKKLSFFLKKCLNVQVIVEVSYHEV